MTATISADGLIEIPAVFRAADAIKEGQQCDIERVGLGEYRLRVNKESLNKPTESWVDILLACPVKGFSQPMERGETTDDLKTISFK